MSRGFVAVVPPDDVLDAVEAVLDGVELPDGARRTERSKLHLTVRFLGNAVRFGAVEELLRGLDLRGGRAQLGRAGAFSRPYRGDVLWVGVVQGADVLDTLNASVEAGYNPHRPAGERSPPFHPHLTVARCREPVDLRRSVRALGKRRVGPAWDVDEVVLVQSHLGHGPAVYEEQARIPLAR